MRSSSLAPELALAAAGESGALRCSGMIALVRPDDLGAAQDRHEVLRVHDRIESHEQGRVGGEELLQRPGLARLELRGDALVHSRSDHVQPLGGDHLDADQAAQLIEARIVAEPGSLVDPDHPPRARRLEHRVPPMDERRFGHLALGRRGAPEGSASGRLDSSPALHRELLPARTGAA